MKTNYCKRNGCNREADDDLCESCQEMKNEADEIEVDERQLRRTEND